MGRGGEREEWGAVSWRSSSSRDSRDGRAVIRSRRRQIREQVLRAKRTTRARKRHMHATSEGVEVRLLWGLVRGVGVSGL